MKKRIRIEETKMTYLSDLLTVVEVKQPYKNEEEKKGNPDKIIRFTPTINYND